MKRYGTLIGALTFAMLFLAACGSQQPATPPAAATPPPPPPPSDQDRLAKYQQCWGYYNDKQFDQLKGCYTASATSVNLSDPPGKTSNGADAIDTATQAFAKSVPDIRGDAQLLLVNGTHVAGIYLLKGTNSAPMTGADGKAIAATNKPFALLFGHTVDFAPDELKVVKETEVMDSGTFFSQLGLRKTKARGLQTGAASAEIVMAKNDATEKANLDAENAQLAAWNQHDEKGVQGYVADHAVAHVMADPQDSNQAQSKQMDAGYWKAFPDARINTASMWAAGDYVTFTGTFEGTNDGAAPAMGIRKKTGKKVSVPFLEVDKFVGGKVQETWLFFDGAQFATQMGMTGK